MIYVIDRNIPDARHGGRGVGAAGVAICREDRAADQFRDLRDYGVSAGTSSVQPIGNPISHSWRHGFVREGIYVPRRSAAFLELLPPAFDMPLLRGVGNISRDPNSISDMGGAKVGSLNAVPLRIIPERGQVTEDAGEPCTCGSRKEFWNVFHDCESWSNFANEAGELRPKTRPRAINALSASSFGQVLTREASANDIDGNSIGSKPLCCEFSNVMIARHLWPVFRQHTAWKFFDLAESDGFEAAGALKAEREAADAGKQVQHLELFCHNTGAIAAGVGEGHRSDRLGQRRKDASSDQIAAPAVLKRQMTPLAAVHARNSVGEVFDELRSLALDGVGVGEGHAHYAVTRGKHGQSARAQEYAMTLRISMPQAPQTLITGSYSGCDGFGRAGISGTPILFAFSAGVS